MVLLVALLFCTTFSARIASAADKEKTRSRAQKALRAGDFELAEKIFRELLARNERDTDARLGLSHTLLKERRFQDSFDQAASVLTLHPSAAPIVRYCNWKQLTSDRLLKSESMARRNRCVSFSTPARESLCFPRRLRASWASRLWRTAVWRAQLAAAVASKSFMDT